MTHHPVWAHLCRPSPASAAAHVHAHTHADTQGVLVKTPTWVQGGCFEKGSRIRQRAVNFDPPGGEEESEEKGPRDYGTCCS